MVKRRWEAGKWKFARKRQGKRNRKTGEFIKYGSSSSLDRKYHERTKFFKRR